MTDTKNTPGPWVAFQNPLGTGVTSEEKDDIAHCHGMRSDRSESEILANAAIMAAAPDMLEALEAMLVDFVGPYDESMGSVGRARAAIAKAKGGAV